MSMNINHVAEFQSLSMNAVVAEHGHNVLFWFNVLFCFGTILAALGAKGLVSVHVQVHEPAFMAATIIKKEKRNKVLYDIEVFVWF